MGNVNDFVIENGVLKRYKGRDEDVVIPEGVTKIGDDAFYNCISLESITIPDSVTSIGDSAFNGCTSLTSVTIPDSVAEIGYGAFENTAWYDNQPDGVVYAGKVLYTYKGEMPENTTITLKDGTKGIGDYAFARCKNLTRITIPNTVTSIGKGAFCDCISLASITIPNSITSIESYVFKDCSSLARITIPDSITSIENEAFSGCSGLTEITIPDSVSKIRWGAFEYCSSLTDIVIPDGITSIEGGIFYFCESLINVTIPNSVKSIDREAFRYCNLLTNIYYKGTKEEWSKVKVNLDDFEFFKDNKLRNATMHFNYIPKQENMDACKDKVDISPNNDVLFKVSPLLGRYVPEKEILSKLKGENIPDKDIVEAVFKLDNGSTMAKSFCGKSIEPKVIELLKNGYSVGEVLDNLYKRYPRVLVNRSMVNVLCNEYLTY